MPDYVAAIDQGTTSTRCILFDRGGNPVSVAQAEHRQIYPQPGWVEHDPLEIWDATCNVIRGALARGGVRPAQIATVGIANQRETVVLWDPRTGRPYTNAIVWQDTRSKDLCDQLAAAGGQDRFRARTGLPLATYFSGPKIRWALDNVPELRTEGEKGTFSFSGQKPLGCVGRPTGKAECPLFSGTIDTWLVWQLTGGARSPQTARHVTDVTNASRTQLMDLGTLDWDDAILEAMGVPRAILPAIAPSSDPAAFGVTDPAGPFGAAIPICGVVGDQQAALLGQACIDPGDAKNTYGTGCFLLLNTGEKPVPSTSGLLTTVGYQLAGRPPVYALEGSVAIAGALVQWLRDNLGLIQRSDEVEALAASVPDSGGCYIVPAFSGLFAPRWRSDARGIIAGLTRFITKAHLARAALEATAYQTAEVLQAMRRDAGRELSREGGHSAFPGGQHTQPSGLRPDEQNVPFPLTSLRVDGGMVVNELLMQFQADILGAQVIRPRVAETTALGAAYAAGLACGFWSGLDELRANWQADRTWRPRLDAATRQRLFRGWLKAVERSLEWVE